MTTSYQPLQVLIIGAGIAGLSTAIALGKQGHHVVVFPRKQLSSLLYSQFLTLLRF